MRLSVPFIESPPRIRSAGSLQRTEHTCTNTDQMQRILIQRSTCILRRRRFGVCVLDDTKPDFEEVPSDRHCHYRHLSADPRYFGKALADMGGYIRAAEFLPRSALIEIMPVAYSDYSFHLCTIRVVQGVVLRATQRVAAR